MEHEDLRDYYERDNRLENLGDSVDNNLGHLYRYWD
jgi:hypothetical protein